MRVGNYPQGPRRDLREFLEGSVTIVLLSVVAIAALFAVFVGRLGTAAVARARAETASDAAALAAAIELAQGHSPVEARIAALRAAHRNGAQLVSCACSGDYAQVRVKVPLGSKNSSSTLTSTSRAQVRGHCLFCNPRS